MLDFPRWKRVWICFVLACGVLLAIPSLIGETQAKRFGVGFLPRINLGLDLSGGSHILLEADTADVTKARLAQEWMSWTLPARCPAVADALEKRARLLGASLKVNAAPEDAPTPPTEQATAEPAPSGKN